MDRPPGRRPGRARDDPVLDWAHRYLPAAARAGGLRARATPPAAVQRRRSADRHRRGTAVGRPSSAQSGTDQPCAGPSHDRVGRAGRGARAAASARDTPQRPGASRGREHGRAAPGIRHPRVRSTRSRTSSQTRFCASRTRASRRHRDRAHLKTRTRLERILRGYLRNHNVAIVRYYAPPPIAEAVQRAARAAGADRLLEVVPLPPTTTSTVRSLDERHHRAA